MTQPRNLWPLGIILTFVIFISGTVALVIFACSQRVDLVSADYYEQELKFQGHLDQLNRTGRLGRPASVGYDGTTHRINISVRPEPGAHRVTGHIQLYRPSAAGLDRHFSLELDRQGRQSLDAAGLRPGLWKVRVSWNVEDQQYFLDESIIVGSA